MGGLDARYLISRLGMASRVLSLTTLGTPHRGTVFADWGIHRLGRIMRPFFRLAGIPSQAFYDLTTTKMATFNQQTPDAPGVRYYSVAARFQRGWLSPEWQLSARIVDRHEGDNDGIVSVASARHGESFDVWEGDHMHLVNWMRPWSLPRSRRDRTEDYAGLLSRLKDQGF
jgi:triacylglycerol lipase